MSGERLIRRALDWDNLVDAWTRVQEGGGAAGSDGVSVARWGRTWEERLVTLRRAVLGNTYVPAPLERFTVPKRGGGVRRLPDFIPARPRSGRGRPLVLLGRHRFYGFRRRRLTKPAFDSDAVNANASSDRGIG